MNVVTNCSPCGGFTLIADIVGRNATVNWARAVVLTRVDGSCTTSSNVYETPSARSPGASPRSAESSLEMVPGGAGEIDHLYVSCDAVDELWLCGVAVATNRTVLETATRGCVL